MTRRPAARLGAVLAGSLALAGPASADTSLEYAVKAAYLAKFAPFIQWPDAAFAGAASPVTICVLGADPFGGKLEQAAGGVKSGDRALAVHHVTASDPGCQILFLNLPDPAANQAVLDALKGKPVLTVSDSGAAAHGIVSFVVADNHVRFDIDDELAAQDGLSISSKLLGLAHAVHKGGQP